MQTSSNNDDERPEDAVFMELEEGKRRPPCGGVCYQYFTGIVGVSTIVGVGIILGWTSPAVYSFQRGNYDFENVTTEETSWIATTAQIAATLSPIPSSLFIIKVGRRGLLIISAILGVVAWLIMILAKVPAVIILGRFVSGVSFSIANSVASIFVSEIVETRLRGTFSSMVTVMLNVGLVLVFSYGPYVSYLNSCLIGEFVAIAILGLLLTIPESPYHYLLKNDPVKAAKSFIKVRSPRNQENIRKEFQRMKDFVAKRRDINATFLGAAKEILSVKSNRRAFCTVSGLFIGTHLSGIGLMFSFQTEIFHLTGSDFDPDLSTIICGVVRLIASCVSSMFIDHCGRKPLLYISGTGCFLSHFTTGTFFFLQYLQFDVSYVAWVPILGLYFFAIFHSVGLGPVPMTMLGELFDTNVRGFAGGIITTLNNLYVFALLQMFFRLINVSLTFVGFYFCALTSLWTVFFTYFYTIETRGVTFSSIKVQLGGERTSK